MLTTKFGMERSLYGWINVDTTYYGKIITKEWECTKEAEQTKLLKHLAHKLEYPKDMKVAEHALCKSMRTNSAHDLFFPGQSLFDIRRDKQHGVTVWEKKWNNSEWKTMKINIPEKKIVEWLVQF